MKTLQTALWSMLLVVVAADYDCVCNNGEALEIFGDYENLTEVLGYLNFSECKALETSASTNDFYGIYFEHQIGYVGKADVEAKTCDGDISPTDALTTTTAKVTAWPSGTYGLMKARLGCPAGQWSEGYRDQDTEDWGNANRFSQNINTYMAGNFGDDIRTDFCIKEDPSDTSGDWPVGSYCILKKGTCPTGFETGYIFWDDEDLGNANEKGGVLPDGEFGSNTKIFYCCRDDGSVSLPVALPTSHPFILVRYSSACQSVLGMDVNDLFIEWDEDDLFSTSDSGGKHPLDQGGSEDHLLHFCYYSDPTFYDVPIG